MAEKKSNKGRKKTMPEESPPKPLPLSMPLIAAIAIVIIIVLAFVIVQSGVMNSSGDNAADEAAALKVFNKFKANLTSHNGAAAVDLTTLRFLPHDDPIKDNVSMELINYFIITFSNESLVFSANNIVASHKSELSQAQQAEIESQILMMTDQANAIHINEMVTDYVLITGDISMTGIEYPPEIESFIMLEIGGGWYLLLGN